MKSIAPRFASLFAALCAVACYPAAAVELAAADAGKNAAVQALLDTAERSLSAGRPEEAAIVLERALRIEPRDPMAWHYLGRARLEQGNFAQAEALAAKSHSLAVEDRTLRARNGDLMAAAQQAAGKPVSVPSTEPPLSTLRRLFAAQVEPARTYRDIEDAYAEGVRRARAAWHDEVRPRSAAIFDARTYRRYWPNDWRRRRR